MIQSKKFTLIKLSAVLFAITQMTNLSLASTLHEVEKGDTLNSIADKYGITMTALIDANGINSTNIRPGQFLKIPEVSFSSNRKYSTNQNAQAPTNTTALQKYTIQSGDTLIGLSKRYGVSLAALAQANQLSTNAKLNAKETLLIPTNQPLSQPASNSTNQIAPAASVKPNSQTYKTKTGKIITIDPSRQHVVKYGENLSLIAKKYQVSVGQLAQVNNLQLNEPLHFGDVLNIPQIDNQSTAATVTANPSAKASNAPNIYTVQPNDTLITVAKKFSVDFRDLAKENGLEEYSYLMQNQKLKIPEAKKSPNPNTTPKNTY